MNLPYTLEVAMRRLDELEQRPAVPLDERGYPADAVRARLAREAEAWALVSIAYTLAELLEHLRTGKVATYDAHAV